MTLIKRAPPASPIAAAAAACARGLADWVWPPRSLLSDGLVDRPGAIEGSLWAQLRFLGPPWCACCGLPFATEEPEETRCPACIIHPPRYTSARAALLYDEQSRKLVLDLKRAGRRDGLPAFAAWMAEAAGKELAAADFIAPIPLHWTRLAARRFNQAAWLAQALARRSGRPLRLGALSRIKARASQAGLTGDQRRRNVAGVFRAAPHQARAVQGGRILLIDDVFTTGATLEAAAHALLIAGAREVHALTLARVVQPGRPPISGAKLEDI